MKYLNQELSDVSELKEWVRKLTNEHGNLNRKLARYLSYKQPRLQILVIHARAFSKSDWFLEDYGGKKSTQFGDLYIEYSRKGVGCVFISVVCTCMCVYLVCSVVVFVFVCLFVVF